MPDVTECRSWRCRGRIRFARTESGRTIPVDVRPDPNGNVVLTRNDRGDWRAQVLGPIEAEIARAEGTRLYMPHHATCAEPAAFRR